MLKTDEQTSVKKSKYIKLLLRLQFELEYEVRFTGTGLKLRDNTTKTKEVVDNYQDVWFNLVDADTWTKIPLNIRYDVLKTLGFEKILVPGGIAVGVKPKISNAPQVYVFLDVSHSIGRCELTSTISGVRVF